MSKKEFFHGIEIVKSKELGGPIAPVSPSIIAICANGGNKNNLKYEIVKNQIEATEKFGSPFDDKASPLAKYLHAIFSESNGYVLVRSLTDTPKITDIADMYKAAPDTGKTPKIFLVPDLKYTEDNDVKACFIELNKIAENYGGIALADIEKVDDAKILTNILNDTKIYWLYGGLNSGRGIISASAAMSGLIRRVDNERGFWVSPSNKKFLSVSEIEAPVEWSIGNKLCLANELNNKYITVFINSDGIRPWGNRLGDGDFINVKRLDEAISDSIQSSLLWAIDENIGKALFVTVTETVNNYLRDLKTSGAIIGGSCTVPAELNTPEKISEGNAFFDYEFTPTYPSESIKFRKKITDERLKELFK